MSPHAQRCTLFVTRANSNVNWLRTFRQFRSTESLANFTANIVKHKRPLDLLMGKHSTTWVLQYFSLKSSEQGKLYFWIKRVREFCWPPSLTFSWFQKGKRRPEGKNDQSVFLISQRRRKGRWWPSENDPFVILQTASCIYTSNLDPGTQITWELLNMCESNKTCMLSSLKLKLPWWCYHLICFCFSF